METNTSALLPQNVIIRVREVMITKYSEKEPTTESWRCSLSTLLSLGSFDYLLFSCEKAVNTHGVIYGSIPNIWLGSYLISASWLLAIPLHRWDSGTLRHYILNLSKHSVGSRRSYCLFLSPWYLNSFFKCVVKNTEIKMLSWCQSTVLWEIMEKSTVFFDIFLDSY